MIDGDRFDARPVEEEPEAGGAPSEAVEVRVRTVVDVRRLLVAVGSAVCVLGLTAGVVVADDRLASPVVGDLPPRVVDVPPSPDVLVCPRPLHVATDTGEGEDVAYDPQFGTTPSASVAALGAVVLGAADGVLEGPEGEIATVPAGTPLHMQDPGPARLTVPGQAEPGVVAASVVTVTKSGDLRGTAAAPCAAPAAEHWIVGGSTALGSGAHLVLQNPGRTPATVRVDLWGAAGPLDLAGAPEFLVPAGQQRVVLLEGVAAEQRRIVVHTVVSGGRVSAYLQDSELRGLTPAGVALVTAGAPPAKEQVVSGIDVAASESDGVDTAVLRLLAPDEGGRVTVDLLGPDGPVELPGAAQARLDAGAVLDLPLGGLPAGAYAAVVRSEVPVVAAAMITRGESAGKAEVSVLHPLDRAWLAARPAGGTRPLAVPPAVPRHLVVSAPGVADARVVVRAYDADGAVTRTEATVPGRSTLRMSFGDLADPAPVAVEVLGDDVAWSVTLFDDLPDGGTIAALVPPTEHHSPGRIGVVVR